MIYPRNASGSLQSLPVHLLSLPVTFGQFPMTFGSSLATLRLFSTFSSSLPISGKFAVIFRLFPITSGPFLVTSAQFSVTSGTFVITSGPFPVTFYPCLVISSPLPVTSSTSLVTSGWFPIISVRVDLYSRKGSAIQISAIKCHRDQKYTRSNVVQSLYEVQYISGQFRLISDHFRSVRVDLYSRKRLAIKISAIKCHRDQKCTRSIVVQSLYEGNFWSFSQCII